MSERMSNYDEILKDEASFQAWAESYLSRKNTNKSPAPQPSAARVNLAATPEPARPAPAPTREAHPAPEKSPAQPGKVDRRETLRMSMTPDKARPPETRAPGRVKILGETSDGKLRIDQDGNIRVMTRQKALATFGRDGTFRQEYDTWRAKHSPAPSDHLHDPATMVAQFGDNPFLRKLYHDDPEYQAAFAQYDTEQARIKAQREAEEAARLEAARKAQEQAEKNASNPADTSSRERSASRDKADLARGWQNFKKDLGDFEGGRQNYQAENQFGFLGRYQFGKPALMDLGYMDKNGRWTGKDGIRSIQDFKNNPRVQEAAMDRWIRMKWNFVKKYDGYVGKTFRGVTITRSGLIAGAHLVGPGGVEAFMNNKCKAKGVRFNKQCIPIDGNNVPITKYIRDFGGHNMI